MNKTIGSVLAESKGIGQGFDFLRVALAMMVVLNHSFLIVQGNYDMVDKYKLWSIFGATLPMFFALSGFLISGSAQRLRLKDFLLNRSMRIVPALAVDIFVSALLIGTVFTTLPLHDYFFDNKFKHYFLNIVGFIHYELPGVFLTTPFAVNMHESQVNGSLWTVPYEIGCYAIMSGLIIFGALKSARKLVGIAAVFSILYCVLYFYFQTHQNPFAGVTPLDNYINNFITRGNYLYFYFLSGVLVYVLRERIPYSLSWAGVSAAIIFFDGLRIIPLGAAEPIIIALPIGYLTAYIGLQPLKKLPLYSRGDYSYGIYLYAFPFQQMLVSLFPGKLTVMTDFILTIFLVTGVAMISWHCIEKPILGLRKKFSFTARKGEAVAALPETAPLPEPESFAPESPALAQVAMEEAGK